jgi:hypothetical protein
MVRNTRRLPTVYAFVQVLYARRPGSSPGRQVISRCDAAFKIR